LHGDKVDQLFARIGADGTVAWYLTDRLGSVRGITDASGVMQDQITYDGFGNVILESNPTFGDRYKYTGREFDSETGLQYNRARYYDQTTGRWISQDPLGFAAGDSNLYRYVHNDSTNATDPLGLWDWFESTVWGLASAAATILTGGTDVLVVGGCALVGGVAGGLQREDIEVLAPPPKGSFADTFFGCSNKLEFGLKWAWCEIQSWFDDKPTTPAAGGR
jgi:RHS repeat-associated protein